MTLPVNPTRQFYEYDPDANSFAGVGFRTEEFDIARIHWIDKPLADSWHDRHCHCFDDNPPVVGDFPSISNYYMIPMMSERAWNTLRPVIGKACEALPVVHPFLGTYFVIHVMKTIDALDTDASEVDRSSVADHRIRRIYRYVFREHLIEGHHIFKLPRMSGSGLIVDDVFRRTVEANGLRGLQFNELSVV